MKLQFISGRPITTTDFHAAKPLGMNGQLVLENWHILYELLKNNIGLECATLLLEPQVDRERGEVDWYIPAETQKLPQKNSSRQDILKEAHSYIQQGQQLAQSLLKSSDLSQRQKGQLLLQALQYPDEDSIIATPYGPALIGWGHEPNHILPKDAVLAAKGQATNPSLMAILPPPHLLLNNKLSLGRIWPWLASLLLLFVLLLIPWWTGIIPIEYCRYYWLGPLILLILLLFIIGIMARNRKSSSALSS